MKAFMAHPGLASPRVGYNQRVQNQLDGEELAFRHGGYTTVS